MRSLIDAISDGEPIDWTSVRRRPRDQSGACDYENLETLSKISRQPHDRFLDILSKETLTAVALTPLRLLIRVIARARAGRAARTTVLARSAEALHLARTPSELADAVTTACRIALGAEATCYFFEPTRAAYVPASGSGRPLPAAGAIAMVLTEERLSIWRTHGRRAIAHCLPHEERRWLRDASAAVIVPIRSTVFERPDGLIAIGPRADALGCTRDDEAFLTTLATAAAIAFDNLRLKSEGSYRADELGRLCGCCRRVSDETEGQRRCRCGGTLRTAAVPRQINGKFLVETLLGTGGMGTVYLATDITLRRPVALKTLPIVSTAAMISLQREARTMAALSHRNLATIFGQEYWHGTPILVCEYLAGGTLQQRLARGPLTVDAALTLAIALLDALEYMHAQGVLHRDIKPSNIAFTESGTPKLLDFGVAGLMEGARDPKLRQAPLLGRRPAGTVAYLPPQAFDGETPSAHFDLWALSVVLFETIFGRHPFAAGPAPASTLGNVNEEIPDAVRDLLDRSLNPETRHFTSATAMREALIGLRATLRRQRAHSHRQRQRTLAIVSRFTSGRAHDAHTPSTDDARAPRIAVIA